MNDIAWERPITVGTGRGYAHTITGPREPLACISSLLTTRCEFAASADEECLRALKSMTPPEHARRATVAALLHARIAFPCCPILDLLHSFCPSAATTKNMI